MTTQSVCYKCGCLVRVRGRVSLSVSTKVECSICNSKSLWERVFDKDGVISMRAVRLEGEK